MFTKSLKTLALCLALAIMTSAQSELDPQIYEGGKLDFYHTYYYLDYDNPILGEWELQDTLDMDGEIPHPYDVHNESITFIKQIQKRDGSPPDQLFYESKLNLHTGEYWVRTRKLVWIKRKGYFIEPLKEQTGSKRFDGGVLYKTPPSQ